MTQIKVLVLHGDEAVRNRVISHLQDLGAFDTRHFAGGRDARDTGLDEALGGPRNYHAPNDYYDVLGPGGSPTLDGVIDLPNDSLGVIQHFAPQGQPPYEVRFDRGVTIGANHWERDAPDGVIDLPNDILGVIQQFGHNCV